MDADQRREYFASDEDFDSLFPIYIQRLSGVHFTPLDVAGAAAQFLSGSPHSRVLDIGAGVGKFCIAASFFSQGLFTGIEQRSNFVKIGKKLVRKLGLNGVELKHGNFTDLDMSQFNGIYFFNSFHENLVDTDALDDKIERSPELYTYYSDCFFKRIDDMPKGTRLATYWLTVCEIPGSYRLHDTLFDEKLKLWEKVF